MAHDEIVNGYCMEVCENHKVMSHTRVVKIGGNADDDDTGGKG